MGWKAAAADHALTDLTARATHVTLHSAMPATEDNIITEGAARRVVPLVVASWGDPAAAAGTRQVTYNAVVDFGDPAAVWSAPPAAYAVRDGDGADAAVLMDAAISGAAAAPTAATTSVTIASGQLGFSLSID